MLFDPDTPRTLVLELDLPIRWGDMDMMGHVNNVTYFRYLEQGRISWFDALRVRGEPDQGIVVVNAFCEFLKELKYPGTVRLRLYTAQIGRSSVQTLAEMSHSSDPDTVYARGGAKVVWIDRRLKKSAPWPDEVKALLRRRADVDPVSGIARLRD
ncbi:MAG: thioesterase family protein [Burkholderiaceae bacterium]